ncbi:MAG: hypothetical protein IPP08_12280 [Chlorobiota bacterium]|jgi:hypothetical protein|nr:hypothetical protein [Chlorobiota bacterium]QQS66515.1 MAG: hypothetical protein IPP08_12280 [Chlorobiota bacterium]
MIKLKYIFLFIILSNYYQTVFSQLGGYPGAFMNNKQSAEENGLCGITPLHSNSSQVIFSNSSLLSNSNSNNLSISFSSINISNGLPNSNQFNGTFSKELLDGTNVGIGVRSYGIITKMTNDRGVVLGEINPTDLDIAFAGSLKIANASLGGTIHYVTRNSIKSNTNFTGYSADLSGNLNFNGRLLFGVNLKNIASEFQNNISKRVEFFPLNLNLTAGYYLISNDYLVHMKNNASGISEIKYIKPSNYLYATIQGEFFNSLPEQRFANFVTAGLEYTPPINFPLTLRCGLNSNSIFSGGFSFKYQPEFVNEINLDCAVKSDGTLYLTMGLIL